jgi:sterol desaturase/sphingolipid hydroxylase (fatty acid hydroxylase superfamily)
MLFVNFLAPLKIRPTWWSYVLCIFALDFCRYWAHRLAHENRWLWATHVTHHNGPKYNWSVSFRLGWTQHIKVFFFLPAAFLGFHPIVLFICHQIEVLYQFWIHTEYIRKLPKPIEYFFTTPSHHRVHHAKNEHYLDKNYGSTFIIWDRMFGTFQPEEQETKIEYGITKPFLSYNPITLCFHEWVDLIKDVRKTKTFRDAWRVFWQRPSEIKYSVDLEESKQKVSA